MVQRARKIEWTPHSRISRKEIFDYWNIRNKSNFYSKKINLIFKEELVLVSKTPEIGGLTNNENVRISISSHFEIIYSISETEIIVLDVWDTRQNSKDHPLK